ncbi:MAG: hypothetical protein WD204_08045, partial [Acidimicrobiia bacterium]
VIGAAGVVALIYVILLRLVPAPVGSVLLPYLVFSDPAALGFFFVGGTVLADRAQGVAAAVSTPPVEPWEVVVGRVGVLSAIGSAGGLALGLASGLEVDWLTFAPAVMLTAVLYTCFGYAVAMRSDSVNAYFARATAWSIPLFTPLVAFALDPEQWVLSLWPTTASLVLLRGGAGTDRALVALSVLVMATLFVGRWAISELEAARREARS